MPHLDELAERVERLVLRYQEQLRVNTLLEQQLQQLRAERDTLKARLGAARTRLDAVLERLPTGPDAPAEPATGGNGGDAALVALAHPTPAQRGQDPA